MNPLLIKILFAGILSAFAASIAGSYIVTKKISSISGSISHSVLGGIGLFVFLQYKLTSSFFNPIIGAFLASIIAALILSWMHLKHKQTEDATIASIWAMGMGIGVIFISLTPESGEHLHHFLFGNIFEVSSSLVYTLIIFNLIIFMSVSIFYRHFLLICFDEEQAHLQQIHIHRLYLLLLSLISIAIVLLIQIIGIILVIAILTIPPTIAKTFTKKLFSMMVLSFIICCLIISIGILISFYLDYPAGAITAVIAAFVYIISIILPKKIIKKIST